MFTCIACTKQTAEEREEEEARESGTPSTKEAVKSLTAQVLNPHTPPPLFPHSLSLTLSLSLSLYKLCFCSFFFPSWWKQTKSKPWGSWYGGGPHVESLTSTHTHKPLHTHKDTYICMKIDQMFYDSIMS